MKQCIVLFSLIISFVQLHAQANTWSYPVASIIFENCSSCHHEGSIGPFALMSYQDAIDHAIEIQAQVLAGNMPPWPADPDYCHFAYEAVLDQSEIDAINNWVNEGAPPGNLSLAPPAPTFPAGGSLLDTIDYVVAIPPYTLQYNTDEYRWFVIQPNFTDTVYVNKIEIMVGLGVIHHADISYDVTGNSLLLDQMDPLPGFNGNTGTPTYSFYMNAWQPGGNIVSYPDNWGIAIPPGADFVIEIHYGPGGQGLVDSTKMNLQFVTNTSNVRPITVGWLLYGSAPCLLDGPLVIPAYTVQTFHQQSYAMSNDKSFISICPHMHLLGKSYRVWFETNQGDSVPLIDIPDWDFHWQKYYTFQQVQKIPAGAKLKSEGVYDNTSNNPDNPNDPPITVYNGSTTMDEMFLCYFIYTNYQAGDESIILDSTIIATSSPEIEIKSEWFIYPNPVSSEVIVHGESNSEATVVIRLRNVFGQEFTTIYESGTTIQHNLDMKNLPAGIYFVEIISEKERWVSKIVKR